MQLWRCYAICTQTPSSETNSLLWNIVYPADALEQVISLIDTWWSNIGEKQTLMLILSTARDAPATPVITVHVFYNGSEEEGRANFKPFFDLKPIADYTKEIPYEKLNASQVAMISIRLIQ